MNHNIYRDYIVNRRFFLLLFLFIVVWPEEQTPHADRVGTDDKSDGCVGGGSKSIHTESDSVSESWSVSSSCFKPSQPRRIMSGLRETSKKRYMVERTSNSRRTECETGALSGEFLE